MNSHKTLRIQKRTLHRLLILHFQTNINRKYSKHRKLRNSFEFLVSWKGYPTHESSWEPLQNFTYEDGTIHETLIQYAEEHGIPIESKRSFKIGGRHEP